MKKNRITESTVLALATLLSAFVWSGLRGFLFSGGDWIFPLVGFLVLCVLLSLSWLLLRSRIVLVTTLAIILFGYFINFGFNWVYFSVIIIAFSLFFYGSGEAIDEKDVRVKVSASKIIKVGLPSLLTGFILLGVTAYYFSPMSATDFQLPRPLFDAIMKTVPLPSFRADLPGELGQNIETTAPLTADDEVMYQMANQVVHDYVEPYKNYFAAGLAVGVFFLFKTLSVPFMWLVVFVSWLLYKLLVSLGAIKICEKSVLQEVIE